MYLSDPQGKVLAKMTFTGIHRGEFMGHSASRKRVNWKGCALFTFHGESTIDVRVFSNLKGLEEQLIGDTHSRFPDPLAGTAFHTCVSTVLARGTRII